MEQLVFDNLSFTYPLCDKKALDGLSFSIKKGEFIVLCGKSGCGKTTLLKQIKQTSKPEGKTEGSVMLCGRNVKELSERESAEKTGYVMQEPDSQIVTDKVWHELAFGLENLGCDRDTIRLRTGEMAMYLGIKGLLDKRTDTLSGGSKQLINLAAVMVMKPDIILFDEPTSQLDPVAASSFLATVSRINRELGITVIMTEHRLEEALSYADRVLVMDSGRQICFCPASELVKSVADNEFIQLSLPAPMRIFSELEPNKSSPVTVAEGARRLGKLFEGRELEYISPETESSVFSDEYAVRIKSLYFRYERKDRDIICDLNLTVPKGCFYAILGGNGEGKTTLLKLITGVLKPYSGKIKTSSVKISCLPQDVRALFTHSSVREELGKTEKTAEIARLTQIETILDRHPYDISGGEMQRVALAMLLSVKPDIILLDEPTKGMDAEFKAEFASMIGDLIKSGKTVIAVSHDVEFCARYADICTLLSGGESVATGTPEEFFGGNLFFTTGAGRMSAGIFKNAVTDTEVIELCKKNLNIKL